MNPQDNTLGVLASSRPTEFPHFPSGFRNRRNSSQVCWDSLRENSLASHLSYSCINPARAAVGVWTQWKVMLGDENNQPLTEAREWYAPAEPTSDGFATTIFKAQLRDLSSFFSLQVEFTWTNKITGENYPVGNAVVIRLQSAAEARHTEISRDHPALVLVLYHQTSQVNPRKQERVTFQSKNPYSVGRLKPL